MVFHNSTWDSILAILCFSVFAVGCNNKTGDHQEVNEEARDDATTDGGLKESYEGSGTNSLTDSLGDTTVNTSGSNDSDVEGDSDSDVDSDDDSDFEHDITDQTDTASDGRSEANSSTDINGEDSRAIESDSEQGNDSEIDDGTDTIINIDEPVESASERNTENEDTEERSDGGQSVDGGNDGIHEGESDTAKETDIACDVEKLPVYAPTIEYYEFCVEDNHAYLVEVHAILEPLGPNGYSYVKGSSGIIGCNRDEEYLFWDIPPDISQEILCELTQLDYIEKIGAGVYL